MLWALGGMRLADAPRAVARHGGRGLRSGLRYVRRQPAQAALLLALGLVSALGLQANVLMPSLAQRTFGRGPTGYGLLLTGYGVGAVLSALRLASRALHAGRAPEDAPPRPRSVRGGAARRRRQPGLRAGGRVPGDRRPRDDPLHRDDEHADPAAGRRRVSRPGDGAAHRHVHGDGAARQPAAGRHRGALRRARRDPGLGGGAARRPGVPHDAGRRFAPSPVDAAGAPAQKAPHGELHASVREPDLCAVSHRRRVSLPVARHAEALRLPGRDAGRRARPSCSTSPARSS